MGGGGADGWRTLEDLTSEGGTSLTAPGDLAEDVDSQDTAVMCFSSGTEGLSKGVEFVFTSRLSDLAQ